MSKDLEEPQKFTLEKWNKTQDDYSKKFIKNYLKRVKKVLEIRGNRLEPFHLNKIRKEIENEEYIQKNEEKIKTRKKIKDY